MAGLSSALAMQGRMGDSTLVHMNPMEVEMLKTMSPDGSLSINPETGLPEAFKLKDLAAFALPIAASVAFPMLAPSIGLGGLSSVATGAIGAGLGGVGAGFIQDKDLGDSLIQGGLSGLMSYGLGSAMGAFAPSGGVTAGPPTQATMAASGQQLMSTAPDTVGAVTTAAASEPTGFFGGLGETLKQTPFTDVPSVGSPTYGSMLGSGASGLLASGLTAEEVPYDIDGMDDMDAYYAGRIPDLRSGRRRGRAAARGLNYPPSGGSAADYYGMATSPGGFGTFYAAEGGLVPNAYGDTYGDPYGPGDAYGGVADASNTSGTPGSESTSGSAGTSGLGSFGNSIDMGLGVANPSPMGIAASLAGLALGIPGLGPAVAIGRGIAGLMGPANVNAIGQSQVSGVGNQSVDAYGNPVGSMENIASEMNMGNKGFDAADDVEGMMSDAVQGFADAHEGEVGDAGAAAAANADAAASAAATADAMGFAQGGIASLAYGGNPPTGYANQAFEGTVPGVGTGMSDDVPFSIEGNQPALLSRDEYVLPADVVSQLGDGSSGAGSDMLDNFISQVRQTKYGNTQQPPPVGPQLMTGLMREGGIV